VSTSRSIISFLVTLLMPFALVGIGAGIVALGFWLGWTWLVVAGGVVVLAGVLFGVFLFLWADAGAL
jgi:hypothetical protein